jgi:hypothetical protein
MAHRALGAGRPMFATKQSRNEKTTNSNSTAIVHSGSRSKNRDDERR